jgi:membrane protein
VKPREAWGLLRGAVAGWLADGAPRLGAALAYYTLFSLAPLLLAAIAIAGLAFGEEAAQGRIVAELQSLIGRSGAEAVQAMIEGSRRPSSGIVASLVALATLLVGASGVFVELKGALNVIFDVREAPSGLKGTLRARLAAFALVLAVGFLLLVSLLVSAALSAMGSLLSGLVAEPSALMHVLNAVLSLVVITVLIALLFKFLPDTRLAWRDVWVGAVFTSALFTAGKFLIGLYLGSSGVSSTYGAAASVVVLMIWVYYAGQIFFLGAELTQAWALRRAGASGLSTPV